MKLVLAVVGAVVGAVFGSLFYHKLQLPGGVVGALFGFLLGSMNELRERISHLEQEMTVLRRQERPLAAPQVKKEAPPSEELSRPDPVPPRPEPMVKPSPQTPPQHTEQIDPSSFTADFAWEKIEKPQSLLLEKLQSFFRGNLLVKAGVVILFFGVAFLVKFAAEHSLLPIELRLAATAAGAVALIAIGWRLRVTRTGYGLVLQGGGIGILYLTIFAAFRLYDLLPASLALGLLVFLCLFSSALAIFQDSLSLAQLGASGGFIAPVLCSTGGGSHVALFSYYAVLNTGILDRKSVV